MSRSFGVRDRCPTGGRSRIALRLGCLSIFWLIQAAAFSLATAAPADTLVIRAAGVDLSYDKTELRATAGDTLTIRFDNSESEMTHNLVLVVSESDIEPVGLAALDAHRTDYIPENEQKRILAFSALAYPGDVVDMTFVVPPPGTYPYICTYSGHFTMMQGRLISTD